MDYSKLMASASDEELIVAVIESLECDGLELAVIAEEIRQAFKDGYLRSIADNVVEAISEEIELTQVATEAENETLQLNEEEFQRAIQCR